MKIFSGLKLCVGATLLGLASAAAPTPVSNVHVTLKGKKYQIDDVTTVSELQERLEEQSGIPPSKQGKILHNGKRLLTDSSSGSGSGGDSTSSTSLSEAGVAEGDQLNCVPAKKSSGGKKKSATSAAAAATSAAAAAAAPASDGGGGGGSGDSLADMMKGLEGALGSGGAGGLDDMMSKLMAGGMGGGGGGGGMPDMAESMQMMKELTNSPLFSEYMNDPEKLEESRQMILNNPMMKAMMASMPGMSDILEDKEAWAQAMMAAAGIMQAMDPEDMMKMMEAGAGGGMMPPGMGGMGGGGGLFDGAGASSALDELSEDDE